MNLESHLAAREIITASVRPEPSRDEPLDNAVTLIERRDGWRLINLREIWRARELLLVLAWRDVKVRYQQTVLGVFWAVLQPLAMMLVCTITLGRLSGDSNTGLPYPIFVFAGFLPWFFFSNTITAAAQSVVSNQSLITKVYFPRLLIPFASIGPNFLDLIVGGCLLAMMMSIYGIVPGWGLILAPAILIGLILASLGVGVLLAALTVAYRDFRYVVPFLVQFWMLATPSVYLHADAVGPRAQFVMPFNPAYGLILNLRASLLGTPIDYYSLSISIAVSAVAFILGCFYFRRVERGLADII